MTSPSLTPEQIEAPTVEELARLKEKCEAAIRAAENPSVGYPEYARIAEPFRRAVHRPTDVLAIITDLLSTRTRLDEALADLTALSAAILGGRSGFALVEAETLRQSADTLAAENARLREALRVISTMGGYEWSETRSELQTIIDSLRDVALAALSVPSQEGGT